MAIFITFVDSDRLHGEMNALNNIAISYTHKAYLLTEREREDIENGCYLLSICLNRMELQLVNTIHTQIAKHTHR